MEGDGRGRETPTHTPVHEEYHLELAHLPSDGKGQVLFFVFFLVRLLARVFRFMASLIKKVFLGGAWIPQSVEHLVLHFSSGHDPGSWDQALRWAPC